MSGVKVAGFCVGGVLVLGAMSGGLARDPQTGQIDPKESITQSFDIGAGRVGGSIGNGVDVAAEAAGRGALSAAKSTVEESAILSAPGNAISAVGDGAKAVAIEPAGAVLRAAEGIVAGPADPTMVGPRGNGGGGW